MQEEALDPLQVKHEELHGEQVQVYWLAYVLVGQSTALVTHLFEDANK